MMCQDEFVHTYLYNNFIKDEFLIKLFEINYLKDSLSIHLELKKNTNESFMLITSPSFKNPNDNQVLAIVPVDTNNIPRSGPIKFFELDEKHYDEIIQWITK